MKPGAWPEIPKMLEKIREAGYKPIEDQVELVVSGTVVKRGDTLLLELDGMKSPTSLSVVAAKEDPDTAVQLNRHVGDQVEVEGLWKPDPQGPDSKGSLAVTAIYGAEDKRPKR